MSKNRLSPKKDVVPTGQLRYEVETRELLHLQGGVEITVNLLIDVKDTDGQPHRVVVRLPEDDFLKFTKEVAMDLFELKRRRMPDVKPPGFPDLNGN